MLPKYEQRRLSEYEGLYDVVVDENHLLRKIKEHIDFSFANQMLAKCYCEDYGRPAKEPEMMFKQELLKTIYQVSDEELIKDVQVNMAYKYFLGMNPEDKPISPSLMTKFRKRITEEVLEEMLEETVKQAIKLGIIKSKMIIEDATHTKASAKQETPTQILRKLTKNLRKQLYKNQKEVSSKFPNKPAETSCLEEEIKYSQALVEAVGHDIELLTNQINIA